MSDTQTIIKLGDRRDEDGLATVEVTDLSAEDQAARTAEAAAIIAGRPMEDWIAKMKVVDKDMPRYLEDHITDAHNGVASNAFQQAKYDAKVALRLNQPKE